MKQQFLTYVLLLSLSFPAIFWRLGEAPIYRSMEGRECLVIQEIVRSNEWILPLRNGEDVPHKPPLMHWIGALMARARGGLVDEWTVRLPSALASLFSLSLLFELVRREHGAERGALAALVLLTCEAFTRQAREAWVDATLSACILGAFFCFWQIQRTGRWKGAAWYGFFAWTALGILSKGPVGLIIPFMAATAFLISTGRQSEVKKLISPAGISMAAIIALSWYLSAWARGGQLFFTTHVIKENLLHFFRGQEGARPFYFFVPGFLVEAAPWSIIFPWAAWQAWKRRREPTLETLCLWWWLTAFVFFSLAAGKRKVYLLPTMPAVAVLVVAWLSIPREWRPWRGGARLAGAAGTCLILLALCAWVSGVLLGWWPGMALLEALGSEAWRTIFSPLSEALSRHPSLMAASAVGVAAGAALVVAAAGSGQQRLLVTAVLAFLCFFTAVPKVIKRESYKWQRTLKNFSLATAGFVDGEPLYYYRTGEIPQAFFYLDRHVPRAICEYDPRGLAACPPGYYFIDTRLWAELPQAQRGAAAVVLKSAGMDGPVKREDLLLLRISNRPQH